MKSILILYILLCSSELQAQKLINRQVLSGKVDVLMPSDFKKMDTAMLVLKYPLSSGRPDEAYTNSNASVSFAFNHTDKKASAEEIKNNKEQLVGLLKRKTGVQVISQRGESINGKDFIVIDFYSVASNANMYNKMFITSLDGRILMGSFNCVSAVENIWKAELEEIIHSLKVH